MGVRQTTFKNAVTFDSTIAAGGAVSTTDSTAKVGHKWIHWSEIGPEDLATELDIEAGEIQGINCGTTETLTWMGRFPHDLDVTAATYITPWVIFAGVSDGDVFEVDCLYDVMVTGTTDPVIAVASTAADTDASALTIVEATHEDRLCTSLTATIDADTFTTTNVSDDALNLGWTITLTTMAQTEFIILGFDIKYTKKFV